MREEEVKNRVREQYFADYDATPVLGDIDFAVAFRQTAPELYDREYLLWAEAKNGTGRDIYASLIQLILTIGRARTYTLHLPPMFLGAFDEERMAFVRYSLIADVFHRNDFNWHVTPSDHTTPEFRSLYQTLHGALERDLFIFSLREDDTFLRRFIRQNFRLGQTKTRGIEVTRNNFVFVFRRWEKEVKPTIAFDWKKDSRERPVDYFLADLISRDDRTLLRHLQVKLRGTEYNIDRGLDEVGLPNFSTLRFRDRQKAYREFWNKYRRPPREDAVHLILDRRDLLATEDKRAYYGAYYTPTQWVELSREYLARHLGDDWQEQYYIWDCAAGTGNLLVGLTAPYRTWASTLEDGDVNIIRQRVADKNLALLDSHVFRFDFLNDPFDSLPQSLQDVINDPEKRKRLIVYINPPYAEVSGLNDRSKPGVNSSKIHEKYSTLLGTAGRELFTQFLMRIYKELPSSIIANFSKIKGLQGAAFKKFRQAFRPKLQALFIVPAKTFDNVSGEFPIGFFIWNPASQEVFQSIKADIYDADGYLLGNKTITCCDNYISKWIGKYRENGKDAIGFMAGTNGNGFQHNDIVYLLNRKEQMRNPRGVWIKKGNLVAASVYFAVRKVIPATWLNDRDQFLSPNEGWAADREFQGDCLAYTLFSNANNIQSRYGVNHWIPYSEAEVGAVDNFRSHFMHDYITQGPPSGGGCRELSIDFGDGAETDARGPFVFSAAARTVMDAGRELWRYYHLQAGAVADASFYDIRLHFQGTRTTSSGRKQMNAASDDATYTALIATLRKAHAELASHIEPKVYEYGFLMR